MSRTKAGDRRTRRPARPARNPHAVRDWLGRTVLACGVGAAVVAAVVLPWRETGDPSAQGTRAPAAVAGDQTRAAAEALAESPVYVDPAMNGLVDAEGRAEVAAAVAQAQGRGLSVHVAVRPSSDEDETGGDLLEGVERIASSLGRPGVYLLLDQDRRIEGTTRGLDPRVRIDRYLSIGRLEGDVATSLVEEVIDVTRFAEQDLADPRPAPASDEAPGSGAVGSVAVGALFALLGYPLVMLSVVAFRVLMGLPPRAPSITFPPTDQAHRHSTTKADR